MFYVAKCYQKSYFNISTKVNFMGSIMLKNKLMYNLPVITFSVKNILIYGELHAKHILCCSVLVFFVFFTQSSKNMFTLTNYCGLISGENNCYNPYCVKCLCCTPKINFELLKSPYISIIIGNWSLQRSLPTATDSAVNLRAGFH